MKLDFIPLDKLHRSHSNMRFARKAPDVTDILPSIRARGVIVPIIVRPEPDEAGAPGFGVIAGDRRYTAAVLVANHVAAAGGDPEPMPCAIMEEGDDAAALEASMIENMARLDPDEVKRWESFTRLVKDGRSVEDIAATFGLPELAVKRTLALGNLLPRIRSLYSSGEIDRATVRTLTLASKRQQADWLKLVDDPQSYAPRGSNLKSWLLGGQTIKADYALFDATDAKLATIADLFGEDQCFADASAFWTAQNAAIEARREQYLAAGWAEVVIVPPSEHFATWEYEKRAKRKGGRVYLDVRGSGEVVIHEGYVSRREAERAARNVVAGSEKPKRPEISSATQAYVDLHRRAAVAATLTEHPGVALRLMLAFAIAGAPLWNVKPDQSVARDEAAQESVETCAAETAFDARRRAVLALLGCPEDKPTVTNAYGSDDRHLVTIFLRLLDLPDPAVLDVVAVVMGETLGAGHAAIEAVGLTLGIDMARWWQADPAFFDLIRDKQVLTAMVAEVAGQTVADANAKEKGATLKKIVTDHLAGADGRAQVTGWVPRWMRFPPAAYTERGGVATVAANAKVAAAKAAAEEPMVERVDDVVPEVAPEPERLAA
ncbi:ParB/RepB/Spo0J family partition protein [Sphingomonas pruni]|uniref:ParB/RepB/Spo0J family partition protein n=1 Tax=Sphingomonas pruni TaxID=40683 RepID=UPI0009FD7E7F|nr:ParB N-terminal domain-containing protein [Sphingomonas pruni]